jgi:hypothetical protein
MLRDLHFALRLLVQSPGFTALVAGSLAIGIAVNRAVDPEAPEPRIASLEKAVADYINPQRFTTPYSDSSPRWACCSPPLACMA